MQERKLQSLRTDSSLVHAQMVIGILTVGDPEVLIERPDQMVGLAADQIAAEVRMRPLLGRVWWSEIQNLLRITHSHRRDEAATIGDEMTVGIRAQFDVVVDDE